MRRLADLFTGILLAAALAHPLRAGAASHVVLIVWDVMRPDFVTAETTPTLTKLAQTGVTFKNHHPVYISTTEVNGTALATGVYPGQSGVIGNKEYRPALDASRNIPTEDLRVVRKGDDLTGGHYLAAPTVAEQLHARGLRTVIAGAKPIALLHDRTARDAGALGVTVFQGKVLPEALAQRLMAVAGGFPAVALPDVGRNRWTTHVSIGAPWKKEEPAFSVLSLREPHFSQHATRAGSST